MDNDESYRLLLKRNIARVGERISKAAEGAGRDHAGITLVAVSKTRTARECALAVGSGLVILGENRVQEAREKIPAVAGLLESRGLVQPLWHLVGHLQSNKAKYAVGMFDLIQSLDDYELTEEINRRAADSDKVQDCLIEVNTSGETAKFGMPAENLLELWGQVRNLQHIRLLGLMTVGPLTGGEKATRDSFALLRSLLELVHSQFGDEHATTLSMGMSGDLEWAVAEGSTMVRIGTAIFGER